MRSGVACITAAGAAVLGGVAPANAQVRAGSKRPTPKTIGSDRMPAKNFAPVVSTSSPAPRPGLVLFLSNMSTLKPFGD